MKKIKLILDKTELEYETYALLTSFFPKTEVITKVDETEFDGTMTVETGEKERVSLEISFEEYGCRKDLSLPLKDGEFDKKGFGILIYDFLKEVTGLELPWGNLTGIRPTKLIRTFLEEEADKSGLPVTAKEVSDKVRERAYNERRLSGEKLDTGIEIALREKAIINELNGTDGYSVYIGIPFCPSTCLYCSFTSNPVFKYKKVMKDYLECLKKELLWTAENMQNVKLDTVYIGGGTPTTLEPEELDELLSNVTTILPWSNVKEFTVEAGRADSITREKLEVLRKYPVTRISVNPQTMSDETLKRIGRNHTTEDVREKFRMARELGFDNINMDIILGLPGEETTDVKHTIDEIVKLSPDSLTVHSLAIKRASKLKKWMDENDIEITMDYEEAMKISGKGAKSMGLKPYYLYRQKQMAGNLENTGFAAEGKFGLYNILIMEEVQSIVAIGAGSVSKRVFPDGRIERCDNVKDVGLYLEKIDEMIERKQALFGDE